MSASRFCGEDVAVPIGEKLTMPSGYGDTTTTRTWSQVQAQQVAAKQYWLATNRSSGSPHVVPVDGLWVDDVLYYGGSPSTLHVRAARADPQVTIHLPDPWNVVVVEGEVEIVRPSSEFARRLAELANVKYPDYGMDSTRRRTASPSRCGHGECSPGRRSRPTPRDSGSRDSNPALPSEQGDLDEVDLVVGGA